MNRFIPILLALCLVTGSIAGTIPSYPENTTPADSSIFAPVYDSTKPVGSKDGKVTITTLKGIFGTKAAFTSYTSIDRAKQSDLTAHTGNTSNPHSVTAAQAGAPTLAAFTAHTGDTSNPHSVTALQVGVSTGSWTPTLWGTANTDALSAVECQYIRVGDRVSFSGALNVDPTNAGSTTAVQLSLPVASDFTLSADASGVASGVVVASESGAVYADTTDNRLTVAFRAQGTTLHTIYFSGMYRIR